MNNEPIGVFDSGIGGLTVVKEIMKVLPDENIVYFGDTARVPYGNKSPETVTKFAFQNARFLMSKNVKAIVIACNTASALALNEVQKNVSIPVLGVISSGAKAAVKKTRNGRIGIIGTEGTILSKAYDRAINAINKDAVIEGYACPLFVPLVEEGWAGTKVSYMVAEQYLAPLKNKAVDTLVMGCTHYPLLKKVVGDIMGDKVSLVNPAEETAIALKKVLESNNLQNVCSQKPEYKYYVSDNPKKFCKVANNFLDRNIENIQKIDIETY